MTAPGSRSPELGTRPPPGDAAVAASRPQGARIDRAFSLRSSDDGADVAEVAKQYGGGGHRNAAGFRVSFAQAQAFEV